MLSDDLGRVRRDPAPVLLAVFVGVLLGALFGLSLDAFSDEPPARPTAVIRPATTTTVRVVREPDVRAGAKPRRTTSDSSSVASSTTVPAAVDAGATGGVSRARVEQALRGAVARADARGSSTGIAVLLPGWGTPLLVGAPAGRPLRMWSMSKAVAAVAALRAGVRSPQVTAAMRDALRQSNNCAQRRVVLGLVTRAGGVDGATAAFSRVLADAGASASPPTSPPTGPTPACLPYLEAHLGEVDPQAPTPLFGTARWTMEDAVRFVDALNAGKYGSAGTRVLDLMRLSKQQDTEPGAVTFARPTWGAGATLADREVAWKPGWGGTAAGSGFLVGQLASFRVGGGRGAAAAVTLPTKQPAIDNPEQTVGPQALEDVFGSLDSVLGEG